jgi:large subunit ribosomal protein L29
MKENAEKTRALDTAEIRKQLGETAEQMFRLRFQMSMGQVDGLKKLRLLRKERARMLTILRERELNPDNAAPVKAVKKTKASVKAAKSAKPVAKAKAEPKAAKAPKAAKPAAKKESAKKPAAAKAPAKKKSSSKTSPGKTSKG